MIDERNRENEELKVLAEKENELTNLRIVNNKAIESKRQIRDDIESTEHTIDMLEKQLAEQQELIRKLQENSN